MWWIALRAIGHSECLPINEPSFHLWLCDNRKKVTNAHHRGFDTIATLVVWMIWKESNNRVFNQTSRSWMEITRAMIGEADLWRLARAAIPTSLVVHSDREGSPNYFGYYALVLLLLSCILSPSFFFCCIRLVHKLYLFLIQ